MKIVSFSVMHKNGEAIFVFYDKFKSLCEQKGVSPKRAVTEMGLSNSLATKWKNTGATPSSETLKKIAEYFDVSVAYLLDTEEKPTADNGNGLSKEELELVEAFNMAAPELKALIYNALSLNLPMPDKEIEVEVNCPKGNGMQKIFQPITKVGNRSIIKVANNGCEMYDGSTACEACRAKIMKKVLEEPVL